MQEYVYALHDFLPEHEDEVSFHAGERIEVIERDDLYGDGWWQGRNLSGKTGLFPQSYTTSAPPSADPIQLTTSISSSTSVSADSEYNSAASTIAPTSPTTANADVATHSPSQMKSAVSGGTPLQPLHEESESESPPFNGTFGVPPVHVNGHDITDTASTHRNEGPDVHDPAGHADGEVMQATMTDVQKAIEQLGRNPDNDAARSFSFASTRDRDTETETDMELDTDVDADASDVEVGQNWHKGARKKLAEKARRAVQEAEKLEAIMNGSGSGRVVQPPIEVELSDESGSEDEGEGRNLHHSHLRVYGQDSGSGRDHPHISEVEEEEEVSATRAVSAHLRADKESTAILGSSDTHVAVASLTSREVLNAPEPEEGDTLTATKIAFPVSTSQPPSESLPDLQTNVSEYKNSTSGWPLAETSRASSLGVVAATATPSPTFSNIGIALGDPSSYIPSTTAAPSPPPSASTAGSAPTSMSQTSTVNDRDKEHGREKPHPEEWSVEDVVEWLKTKGFDQNVCDKFTEQEITGDVLLELDVNLLKTEIGIMAFGKRARIANAITDLRRPPSVMYSDHPATPSSPLYQNQFPIYSNAPISPVNNQSPLNSTAHSRNQSNSYSYAYSQSMPSSAHQSLTGPLGNGGSFGLAGPFNPLFSLESAPRTGDQPGSPIGQMQNEDRDVKASEIDKRQSATVSEGSGVIVGIDEGMLSAAMVGLGLAGTSASVKGQKLRPAQLTLSPSESALTSSTQAVSDTTEHVDEERAVMSESEAVPRSIRRRIFGRSQESTSSATDRRDSIHSRNDTTSPLSAMSSASAPRDVPAQKDSKDKDAIPAAVPRHIRGKKSGDVRTTSDRMSLFGNTFGASLGKNRKPPPRYSSSIAESDSSVPERPSALSRFVGGKKSSGRSTSQTSMGEMREKEKSKTPISPKEKDRPRDASVLRKRTSSPPDLPTVADSEVPETGKDSSRGDGFLKPGKSVLEQIGEPDFNGWMRKRGDRYNSWKIRYFMLKGPHLYCLKSNNKTETRIKGYINIVGYRVVADENLDPGRYGFKIIHDHDKTHYFSSDEKSVIREWMKSIMKATIGRDYTKPVISSCNIPTIPLTVAQTMNPAPRPPSPTARDATQKALRRENPHQLSSRDARVLMGLASDADSAKENERGGLDSFFESPGAMFPEFTEPTALVPNTPVAQSAPTRPPRDIRSTSSLVDGLGGEEDGLMEWANSHLPTTLQMTDATSPLFGGLALLRLAESIKGRASSPPVPDSAFPLDPKDDKLDGLFRLFDFLLDNDVKMGSVSINDVRQGKREKIVQLLRALKAWEDKRMAIVQNIGTDTSAFMGPVSMNLR